MDKVGQVAMMANTEVIKEPRGFIKFIQVILAIFAFATTTAYHGNTSCKLKCDNETAGDVSIETSFGYSFRLDSWSAPCGTQKVSMYGNYSSAAEFYVAVGVLAFLYALGAVLLYIFADDKYRQIDAIPAADLVITVIFVLLWLIASSAWADGVSKVKHYSYPTNLVFLDDDGKAVGTAATDVNGGSYASLNVSIIFGFLNMCVWGGNIWFLYKETKWFKGTDGSGGHGGPQAGTPDMPQQRI